jgi:FkbH-like protein
VSSIQESIRGVRTDHLASVIDAVRSLEQRAGEISDTIRIHFLRNYTVEPLEPFLKLHLYRSGLRPVISFGDYGAMRQEVLAVDSLLHRTRPEIIVVATVQDSFLSPVASVQEVDEHAVMLAGLIADLLPRTSATLMVNLMMPPLRSANGIDTTSKTYDPVSALNAVIMGAASEAPSRVIPVDLARLLQIVGENDGIDYRYWYLSRSPFKPKLLDLYAREIAKVGRALTGRTKKCIIFDCDNTLWGGNLGDDGPAGIQLEPHAYPGCVYYEAQQILAEFGRRGVMLAACSKNDERDVLAMLENHPYSRVKPAMLSAWRINWNDKAANVAALIEELRIGADRVVFLDDDAHECELVQGLLPDVRVLRVPERLSTYPRLLVEDGLFDTVSRSQEDVRRPQMLAEDRLRSRARAQFADIDEYFVSLKQVARVRRVPPENVSRVAQLTQKTNQFNLTTRRYSEAEICRLLDDGQVRVFELSVSDRLGDSGLTGVCIVHIDGDTATIDTFLLSCRILGRRLELAFAETCIAAVEREFHIRIWQAWYRPTTKNAQVAGFWERIGFHKAGTVDRAADYRIAVSDRQRSDYAPIHVEEG